MKIKFRIQQLLRMGVRPELLYSFGERNVLQAVKELGLNYTLKEEKVCQNGCNEQISHSQRENELNNKQEVKKMINYNEESRKLDAFVPGESSQFWKPKVGQYKVRALTELEDTKAFEKEGKEPTPQVKIDLLIGEDKFTWTIAKGKSPAGAYGQLCKLGSKKGQLKGLDFMIVVTSDKKKNTYTIVEL